MARLALLFLDTFQVQIDGEAVTRFRSSKNQGLLVYLALKSEQPLSRELLMTLFWSEDSDKNARNNLRQALFQLRKLLGDLDKPETPFLLTSRQSVQFNPESDYHLDVAEFLRLVEANQLAAVSLYPGGTAARVHL